MSDETPGAEGSEAAGFPTPPADAVVVDEAVVDDAVVGDVVVDDAVVDDEGEVDDE